MTDPDTALTLLRNYFDRVTDREYVADARRHSPELVEGGEVEQDPELAQLGLPGLEVETLKALPVRPEPVRQRLDAYLACALTGLDSDQRQLVFQLSHSIAEVCRGLNIELYEPRRKTDPVHHPSVPDSEVFHIDRERVVRSDLLIYLAHYPSTGAGEELDFAYGALVPIVVVTHSESRVSRMVTGIPGMVITVSYDEPEELRDGLVAVLRQIRPQLVQRKIAFSDHDINIVGDRIRRLREARGLTREDLASASSERFPISVEALERLEQSSDRDANPSLIHLREIATALHTTVADLVEPDIDEILLSAMSSWMEDQKAARFGSISLRDRNKLLRRFLLRLIDSLEGEED